MFERASIQTGSIFTPAGLEFFAALRLEKRFYERGIRGCGIQPVETVGEILPEVILNFWGNLGIRILMPRLGSLGVSILIDSVSPRRSLSPMENAPNGTIATPKVGVRFGEP